MFRSGSTEVISRAPRAYEVPEITPVQTAATPRAVTTTAPVAPAADDVTILDTTRLDTTSRDNQDPTVRADTERVVIPLHREELQVGTREVEAGAVRLRKVIRTETVNQPVTLRQEELVIDRLPPGEVRPGSTDNAQTIADLKEPFAEQTITIPLRREEPVVETEVVQTGQVVARKNVATEPTTVRRSVRNEDVEVVKLGDPQNVSISPEFRRENTPAPELAPRARDVGSAPSSQTGMAAGSGNAPIASLNALAAADQLRSLVGRSIELSSAPVHEILGEQLMSLRAPDGKVFLVWSPRIPAGLAPGDVVDIRGRIEPAPEVKAELNLGPGSDQAMIAQPIYIEANDLQRARAIQPSAR